MVWYNLQAVEDLSNILYGLASWSKHPLGMEHALLYVQDIRDICDKLDEKVYHTKVIYVSHAGYGEYVHRYKRNKNTTWYILYNTYEHNIVEIAKIMSNHLTIATL